MNLGFSSGMNVGIEVASGLGVDYLWLLNNDTIVDSNASVHLINFMEANPDVVVAGSTMVDFSGQRIICTGGFRYYKWIGWSHHVNGGIPLKSLDAIEEPVFDYVDGAAIFLRSTFIHRIGGLPCANFLYFEELNLNLCLAPNERIGWCRSAVVHHKEGGSSYTPKLKERSAYHAALSAYRYTASQCFICLPTVIIARILGVTFKAVINRQPGLVMAVLRAFRDFSLGRPADPA